MLSLEEHPGIFSFLVGIIVLVMTAVGLSVVADKRLRSSSTVVTIQREIDRNALQIEELTSVYGGQSRLLKESKTQPGAETVEKILEGLEILLERKSGLEKQLRQLRGAVVALDNDFSNYRAEYRRTIWLAAIGEQLGNLVIPGGREYKQATIARVTDVGLEIRHQDGFARIQFSDLDGAIQERFHWKDDGDREILEEGSETKTQARGFPEELPVVENNPERPTRKTNRLQQKHPAGDREEVVRLRSMVSGWQAKVSQLRRDKGEAQARAGFENQASVPGSLETWNAKVIRLGNEIARAQVELTLAKARLASEHAGE